MTLRFIAFFMILSLLLFSGCNDSATKSESETPISSVETMLSNGDYEEVIETLASSASSFDDYMALAQAYLGMSGFTTDDIIEKINANRDSLMDFAQAAYEVTKNSDAPLIYLDKATDYYLKIVETKCESAAKYGSVELSDFESQVCLFKGLAQTMEVVTVMNCIIEDMDEQEEQNNKLKASSCAMQYGFNGVADGCSVEEAGDVTFSRSGTTYEKIVVGVNGYEFAHLLIENKTLNTKEVILTDGYCLTDNFSSRVDDLEKVEGDASEYEVCPVNLSGQDEVLLPVTQDISVMTQQISINSSLVENLNSGTESIEIGGVDNTTLLESIRSFKEQIFETREYDDGNETISVEDVINFLNEYNN
jgi:hypothetical protein